MSDEPVATSVRVHYNGGGKIALEDYGGESYGYGVSVTRDYQVPEGWTEEQVKAFEVAKVLDIRENIDPILQKDRDILMAARAAR